MKQFLKNHWDEVTILAITALISAVIFIPFFVNNSLDKFDTPGLLSLSWFIREYTFPDFQGWNPYFFAGFPQGILYPPLFHWLVALLGKVFHLSVAYKLIITAAAAFIPFSIYEFSLRIFRQKTWSILNTIALLITLTVLPGYLGFNFDGVFDYGLGPSFVTIPLFFGYLALLLERKKNIKFMSCLFSLMLLTNLVAPFVAGIITIVYFLLKLNRAKQLFMKLAKFGLLSLLLTLFWIIPYLVFRQYTASGFPPMRSNLIISGIALFGSIGSLAFIIWKGEESKRKSFLALLIPAILISALNVIDSRISISIPPIHPFRLQIFSFIPVASAVIYVIQILHPSFLKLGMRLKIMKFLQRNVHISFNLFFVCFCLIFLLIIRLNPSGVDEVELANELDWEGRIMRAYKVTEVLDQSRSVIDRSVMKKEYKFAVDGLLKESSYLAPYYQSLSKSLNPENFTWEKLDQKYIENKQVPEERTKYLMNLLWVKSLFVIDENFPNCENFKKISQFKSNSKNEGIRDIEMYICSYPYSLNSNLVEMVTEKPKVVENNWNNAVDEWWISDNQELFTDKEVVTNTNIPVNFIPDVEFSDDYQKVYISTGVNEEIPFLVKMSYFPKWKAYDKDGNRVEIYRTSPNLMIVPVNDKVTLKYETTIIEWVTFVISVISWSSLVVISVARKIKGI
ncbi:hypothetical protein JW766_01960 [Candidatus Dojkabacteria bacterium]|nr:hypothetical protein [Candidatus Dojkabacteria bacterium]